jgi:anti-anti-sigma factor
MKERMKLQYQIECLHNVAVVACSGRMVRGAALDEFRSRLERLEGLRVLVLDLSEVDQIDAGGLSAMLMLRRWAMQRSVHIKLVDPTPFVRRVLEATHLASVFEIASFEEALCILRAPQCPPNYAVA